MVSGAPDYISRYREKGEETRTFLKWGTIAADTTVTLLDLSGQDVELLHFEFATNYSGCYPQFTAYKSDGSGALALYIIRHDGYTTLVPSPSNLNAYKSAAFTELVYDATNDYYKFGLAYPIRFANGLKITLTNPDIASHLIGVEAIVLIRG